jgi:hypothetical protein
MVQRAATKEIRTETSLRHAPSHELRPSAREVLEVLSDLVHAAALYEAHRHGRYAVSLTSSSSKTAWISSLPPSAAT